MLLSGRGFRRLQTVETVRADPARGQEGRHQGFYPLNSHFLLFRSPAQTRERRPLRKGERQSGYHSVSFATCSQFTNRLLLHRVRHCYAAPSVELPVCVAERYLTLRIRGYMDGYQSSCGRKNSLPFLYSLSSANFAVLRGNGEIHKRGGNLWCPSLLCARRVGELPLNFSEKRSAR